MRLDRLVDYGVSEKGSVHAHEVVMVGHLHVFSSVAHRQRCLQAAEELHLTTVLTQMSSNETIKQAVVDGIGLRFLSLHTVGFELELGQLRPLFVKGLPVPRNQPVVHRRPLMLSPMAGALRQF